MEHALEFHMLAAESGWNEQALKAVFCQRLNTNVLGQLACCDKEASFDAVTDLIICQENLLLDRKPRNPKPARLPLANTSPEPKQLGNT